MKSERLELRLEPELLARLDEARVDVPRAAFVRRALVQKLDLLLEPRVVFPASSSLPSGARMTVGGVEPQPDLDPPDVAPEPQKKIAPVDPILKDPPPQLYKCRSCKFVAPSPNARCMNHGGRLVPWTP